MADNKNRGDQIKDKRRPEAGFEVHYNSENQKDSAEKKAVFNNKIEKFHIYIFDTKAASFVVPTRIELVSKV